MNKAPHLRGTGMSLCTAAVPYKASPSSPSPGSSGKQVAETENKTRDKLADHTSEDNFMLSSS